MLSVILSAPLKPITRLELSHEHDCFPSRSCSYYSLDADLMTQPTVTLPREVVQSAMELLIDYQSDCADSYTLSIGFGECFVDLSFMPKVTK